MPCALSEGKITTDKKSRCWSFSRLLAPTTYGFSSQVVTGMSAVAPPALMFIIGSFRASRLRRRRQELKTPQCALRGSTHQSMWLRILPSSTRRCSHTVELYRELQYEFFGIPFTRLNYSFDLEIVSKIVKYYLVCSKKLSVKGLTIADKKKGLPRKQPGAPLPPPPPLVIYSSLKKYCPLSPLLVILCDGFFPLFRAAYCVYRQLARGGDVIHIKWAFRFGRYIFSTGRTFDRNGMPGR